MSQSTNSGATGLWEGSTFMEEPANPHRHKGTWCARLLSVCCVLCVASVASARAPAKRVAAATSPRARPAAAPAQTSAVFFVRVIEAKKGPTASVDPRLAKMKREFRPFLGQFNQFTLIRDQTLRLGVNQAGAVSLPTGKQFGITMLGFAGGKVRRVRYEVRMPRMRMKRSVAPGARTLDVIRNGAKLTIVSTTVR